MPQVFQVIRCYSCETFQVQLVKKVNKWQCKMCNEKQSVKKVYSQGTGKDCRIHVQTLNAKRMELDNLEVNLNEISEEIDVTSNINEPRISKWNEFLKEETPEIEEDSHLNESYSFDRMEKKRSKQQSTSSGNHCKRSKQSHSSKIAVIDQSDTEHFQTNEIVENKAVGSVVQEHRHNINRFKSKLSDSQHENIQENREIIEKKKSKWDDFIQEIENTDENTSNKNIFCNLDTNLDELLDF